MFTVPRRPLFAVACAAVAALSPLAGCGGKQADPATLAAIQAQYDVQTRGYAAKDPAVVLSVLSPDYADINAGSATKRPEYDDQITKLLAVADTAAMTARVTGGSADEKTADVTVERHLEFTLKKPDTGEVKKITFDETDRDTWVKDVAKGWLKTRSVVTKDGGNGS
jgi:hypothetical protein